MLRRFQPVAYDHPDRLSVTTRRQGARCTITVAGELDLASVGAVEAGVREVERDADHIVLNLRPLEFMDSTGVNLLLRLQRRYDRDRLSVMRPTGSAGRAIEIAGLESQVFAD